MGNNDFTYNTTNNNKEPTVDSLKCCGNCVFRRTSRSNYEIVSGEWCTDGTSAQVLSSNQTCPNWEWDNMTEKERMIR
jgi:hypothetical protein